MKRLLYIACNDFTNLYFGPNAKVLSQCRAFAQLGYQVELLGQRGMDTILIQNDQVVSTVGRAGCSLPASRLRNLLAKQKQMRDIKTYLKGRAYDVCYIRYEFSDRGFVSMLRALRGVCKRIVLELPTYPYEEENKDSILSRIRMQIDRHWRRQLHRYVDLIATFYAGYPTIFDIPVQVIPNGFDYSTMSLAEGELPEDAIHIIAVSSMRSWHGYERFLLGMKNYYASAEPNPRNIVLHLVGNGREYGKYSALVEEYGLGEHVIMEGAMSGAPLDALYDRCALGIDSLARHRSGIDVLSSLKSREYGAKGLPMINSCRIDVIDDDFPYLLRVPADETAIFIPDVLLFYDRCYYTGKSRAELGLAIRSYMEARSGMKETLAPVLQRLDTL